MSKTNHKLTDRPEIDLHKDGYALEWCKVGDRIDVWIACNGAFHNGTISSVCDAKHILDALEFDTYCRPAKWVKTEPYGTQGPEVGKASCEPISAATIEQPADPINHPPHYTHSAIEPINVILEWDLDFCLGNVIKYVARADHKGNKLQDLQKAAFYLNQEIARLRNG